MKLSGKLIRKWIIVILVFTLFSECENKPFSSDVKATQEDSLKKVFMPLINGIWVLTDYITDIEKTHSPYRSYDKLLGIVTLIIEDEIEGDSLFVGSSYNNHEGYSFYLHFIKGCANNSLQTDMPDYNDKLNHYDLGYEVINLDTSLFLYHYNKSNKLILKTQFSKVKNTQPENDAAYGLEYIVNQKLISGNYKLLDDNSKDLVVQFNSNGTLTGLPFKSYEVTTDFMVAVENNLDNICFYRTETDCDCFAFKIDKDTLKVYDIISLDTIGVEIGFGSLRYKLVKQ